MVPYDESALRLAVEFDGVMSSYASPLDVFDFLGRTGGLETVLHESLTIRRMFESDFFFRCSGPEMRRFMPVISSPSAPKAYRTFLVWQLMSSRSVKAQTFKYECRNIIAPVRRGDVPVIDPRRFPAAERIRRFDATVAQLAQDGRFLEAARLPCIEDALKCVGYSLYQGRMMQADFMSALPQRLQPLLLDGVERTVSPCFAMKFAKAVIAGDFPIALKKRAIRMFRARPMSGFFYGTRQFSGIVRRYGSFQEFAMAMAVSGRRFESSTFALYLLAWKPSWMREWLEADTVGVSAWTRCSHPDALIEGDDADGC